MSKCRDLEPLLTPYVDGEAPPAERATVEEHLDTCPPCRDDVTTERVAREVLHARREGLRACAAEHLRTRCAAHAAIMRRGSPSGVRRLLSPRRLVPLSLAATLLLAIGGFIFFALNKPVEALAAQLAMDHTTCFQRDSHRGSIEPRIAAREWQAKHGWSLQFPLSAQEQELVLVDVRQCGSTSGITAHLLYKWRGEPLSVYVLNAVPRGVETREQAFEMLGKEAVVWAKNGRTYAVVTKVRRPELQPMISYVSRTVE